jgi:3-isopropylmalate/(R)-2-methylmalate dehydratase small subunit
MRTAGNDQRPATGDQRERPYMTDLIKITCVSGRPIPLRGNDIDTDRIIPARFMKAVTFDGLGQYAFYDVRYDAEGRPLGHVMDDPRFLAKGPRVALVNKNFGCGSSREHAPQALMRWGVKALVGESFADIFFGNCVSMGIPCVTAAAADVAALMAAAEEDPAHDLTVDLATMQATYRGTGYAIAMPAGPRHQLLEGTWDATRILLAAKEQIRATAKRLPYVVGFGRSRTED